VPEIQVREMESLLQIRSGQTVILGGLIQDNTSNARDGLPVLSRPDGFGALFGQQERRTDQSELVIFLRPVVVSEPSLETSELRQFPEPASQCTEYAVSLLLKALKQAESANTTSLARASMKRAPARKRPRTGTVAAPPRHGAKRRRAGARMGEPPDLLFGSAVPRPRRLVVQGRSVGRNSRWCRHRRAGGGGRAGVWHLSLLCPATANGG